MTSIDSLFCLPLQLYASDIIKTHHEYKACPEFALFYNEVFIDMVNKTNLWSEKYII